MTELKLNISELLRAAKEAGATNVRVLPDGSLDVMFGDVMKPAKPQLREVKVERQTKRPRNAGGVHEVTYRRKDGTEETYWYAHRGGPRISEAEARRIVGAARIVPFRQA